MLFSQRYTAIIMLHTLFRFTAKYLKLQNIDDRRIFSNICFKENVLVVYKIFMEFGFTEVLSRSFHDQEMLF